MIGQHARFASIVVLAAFALACVSGCDSTPPAAGNVEILEGEGLGSTWTVKIAGPLPQDAASIKGGIQSRVDNVARHLSRWDASSSLSLINAAATAEWQSVPPTLLAPLKYALELATDSGGAFDPTVAPLVDTWGFGTAGRRYDPPAAEALEAARARVGYAKIDFDANDRRVRKPEGMQIDLSSMTHGFAADEVAEFLDSIGVHSYLIDVGSELRARGDSPQGAGWRVAIERPPAETGASPETPAETLHTVSLRDAGIATSGNYRYYFDYNGRRYSHRIDPRTGEPVKHDLASVTVIDPACMHADALATALTVLGPDEGFKYAAERNIAALFVLRSGTDFIERMTPRFESYLN